MSYHKNDRSTQSLSSPKIDVAYVAKLARIALTDEEITRFGSQLGDLLEHVAALEKLDVSAIAATAQVIESRNVDRPDTVGESLKRDVVLSMAPSKQGAFFRVPQIIGES